MLYISTAENPRKYYIKKAQHPTTKKGQEYTRIEFGSKNPNSEEYSNWRLTVWSNIDCKEGEYIALKGLTNMKITQFKANSGVVYVNGDINAHTNQVEIYKGKDDKVASVSEETVLDGLPASPNLNSNGFSADNLPF